MLLLMESSGMEYSLRHGYSIGRGCHAMPSCDTGDAAYALQVEQDWLMHETENRINTFFGSMRFPKRKRPERFMPYSAKILILSGTILLGIGLYFIFIRPPLLPEDLRYMGASLAQIQASVPGLSIWLRRVFWVMGGYMFATGLLTCHIAVTGFRARSRGAALVAALAGCASIGWMTTVNFIIHSDFRWVLLLFTLTWVLALLLYWIEGRKKASLT
jgi:hypothetical protein